MTDLALENTPEAKQSLGKRWLVGGAIGLIILIMIAAMTFSFAAITSTATWTGNQRSLLWLAAIFIDGAIITYTLSYASFRWRGMKAKRTLFFMYFFTAMSVAINFAHTASVWHWSYAEAETWFGLLIACLAPIASLFASEEVVRFAFARNPDGTYIGEERAAGGEVVGEPDNRRWQLFRRARKTDPVAETVPEPDVAETPTTIDEVQASDSPEPFELQEPPADWELQIPDTADEFARHQSLMYEDDHAQF